MQIWPAIDLRGGKCVRLQQGDYGRETVFDDDPAAAARRLVRRRRRMPAPGRFRRRARRTACEFGSRPRHHVGRQRAVRTWAAASATIR